jgi:hypothetical protein
VPRLLFHAWSSTRLVGSLVAAFVAERKSADHSGKLLRFGPERERRADRRGHLLDRKSGSAAC